MARSVPADYREFIRLSVDLPDNPKLATIDEPAAGWAYVVSLCYCGRNLTDGAFPLAPLLRQAGVKRAVAKLLIDAGLWHETGHRCERCPQPIAGMAVVHDYLEHQRSAGEAKSLRDARREAGRRGAASRWASKPDGKSHGNSDGTSHSFDEASGLATGEADLWHLNGRPMPEGEGEGEKKTSSSSSESAEPPRDDVNQLVTKMAERVRENGFKVPAGLVAWRRQARLLLDRDGRELDHALRLLDWATSHHFWHKNIRSMDKFREQYDRLVVDANEEHGKGRLRSVSGDNRWSRQSYQPYRDIDEREYQEPDPWGQP